MHYSIDTDSQIISIIYHLYLWIAFQKSYHEHGFSTSLVLPFQAHFKGTNLSFYCIVMRDQMKIQESPWSQVTAKKLVIARKLAIVRTQVTAYKLVLAKNPMQDKGIEVLHWHNSYMFLLVFLLNSIRYNIILICIRYMLPFSDW